MLPVHRFVARGYPGKKSLHLHGLLLCLCGIANQAHGDIYMFTDESGTPNFSNVPTDERYVLTLRTEPANEPAKFALPRSNGFNRMQQKLLAPKIISAASVWQLDPALLKAVIATESGYMANAVSNKGAMGLMQLMPQTALFYGVSDPFDPEQNILAGAQHLSILLKRFNNDLHLALAAYNSGEANVVKYGVRIPPFRETRAYVPKVMGLYRRYQRETR